MPIAHSNTSFLRGSLRAEQAFLKSVKLRVESGAVVVKTWNLLPWLWLKCSLQLVKLSISTGKTSNKRGKYKQKLFSLCSFEEKFCFYCFVFITSTFSIWASRNCQYLLPVGTLFSPKFVTLVSLNMHLKRDEKVEVTSLSKVLLSILTFRWRYCFNIDTGSSFIWGVRRRPAESSCKSEAFSDDGSLQMNRRPTQTTHRQGSSHQRLLHASNVLWRNFTYL